MKLDYLPVLVAAVEEPENKMDMVDEVDINQKEVPLDNEQDNRMMLMDLKYKKKNRRLKNNNMINQLNKTFLSMLNDFSMSYIEIYTSLSIMGRQSNQ